MTARARRMLAGLEDGCATRRELYAHAGRFYLTNNAAAELRDAEIPVVFVRGSVADEDRYVLEDGHLSPSVPSGDPPVAVLEHDRQLAWAVA